MFRSFQVCCLIAFSLNAALPSCVNAQSSTTGHSARNGLSQIDFDRGPSSPAAEPETATLGELQPYRVRTALAAKKNVLPEVKLPQPTKQATRKILNKSDQARGLLSRTLPTDQLATENFLLPRVRGALADKGDSSRISSVETWKPTKAGMCAQPVNIIATCKKAMALRETLYRFSGNNDYFDRQCGMNSCELPDEVSVPQALNIADLAGGSFKMVEHEGSCHYQLERARDGKWLMLKPSRVSCVCLPKSCL